MNRNINKNYYIKKGIITNRCNGKYLPSDICLYNNKNEYVFDRNQATELNIGELVHIIHISKNKEWLFIKTYNYYCWVYHKNIACINNSIYAKYLTSKTFIITIDKLYLPNNKYLDMGIKLPIYEELKNSTKVVIPCKKNNKYYEEIVEINNKYISKGYLKYNKENLIKQATKYLNTHYGWGGKNNGIDCSGFILNIYKTFGIYLPRDTKDQEKTTGTKIHKVELYNIYQKIKLIHKLPKPLIIYTKGHVMLLMNNKEIIHASSKYKKVIINKLTHEIINKISSIHIIEFDK